MSSGVEERAEDPGHLVLARAKAAIAQGDQAGALALPHVLLTKGVDVATMLTPVLAEALIATARTQADEQDRQARQAYARGQAARAEICRLVLRRAAFCWREPGHHAGCLAAPGG